MRAIESAVAARIRLAPLLVQRMTSIMWRLSGCVDSELGYSAIGF